MKTFIFSLFIFLATCAFAADSPRPNFSGTWKLDKSRSKLQIPAPDSSTFIIEHKEPVFKLTRTHVFKGQEDIFSIELTTDGKEVKLTNPDETSYNRMYWKGDRLVFASRFLRGDRESTNEVKYSLSEDGQTFTAEEKFTGPAINYKNNWVFQRAAEKD